MTTHIYLIRHGEAYSNVEPIIGGMNGDKGLTPLGIAQAESLRDRLAASGEIRADVLIASPLPRARQTAEIIAPALNQPIVFEQDVEELRVGEADGMHVGEFREKYGLPDYRVEPFRPIAPGGEYWGEFMLRVATTLDRITREYVDRNIVIVCHGGVVDGSMVNAFQLNSLYIPPVEFHTINTSITEWERRSSGESLGLWRLIRYNDAAHIQAVGRNPHIRWKDVPTPTSTSEEHSSVPVPTED